MTGVTGKYHTVLRSLPFHAERRQPYHRRIQGPRRRKSFAPSGGGRNPAGSQWACCTVGGKGKTDTGL
jgi:hypothetical protein